MTYYADLSPCKYFPFDDEDKLIAVGWLDREHPYERGPVDERVVARLCELLVDPWEPCLFMGTIECELCRFTGGPPWFSCGDSTAGLGSSNLFLPADGFLFVAPSWILHYMDSHDYAPPKEFCDAAFSCPVMRSTNYLRAILDNGPKGLASFAKSSRTPI